jgi:triosephosphate isomerase (TIM)
MRRTVIAGNWKMHKTFAETRGLVRQLLAGLKDIEINCDIIVAPPFTSILAAVEETRGSVIGVSGQNLHWEDKGAFTGEISGQMLREIGCGYAIVGHSERRQYFGETDRTVNLKIKAAMRSELAPIFCLGETLEEREQGATFEVVKRQLTLGMHELTLADPSRFIIAYEPVWAIGTGRTATPEQAQEVHGFLRNELGSLAGDALAHEVRILYGGSVKPENTRGLMNCPDIDGGLVGGASLNAEDFVGIVREVS